MHLRLNLIKRSVQSFTHRGGGECTKAVENCTFLVSYVSDYGRIECKKLCVVVFINYHMVVLEALAGLSIRGMRLRQSSKM